MIRLQTFLMALVLVFLASLVDMATAVEPSRVLNGHEFIPSELVPAPFAVSHFATRTGGGFAFNLKTPFVDLEGETTGDLIGDVAFMVLAFEYQQRFGQWFAARIAIDGIARMGVDEQSILAQGVTGSYVSSVGGIARILQRDKVILSGGLDFAQTSLVGLDPYGFARRVAEEGLESEDNSLVTTNEAYSGRVSLRVGWAPQRWLGVTGYLEGGHGETSGGGNETLLGGGGTVGFDLKEFGLVPLGFQLVGKSDAFIQAGADIASRAYVYGITCTYTGWDDFSVGLEMSMSKLERRNADNDFEAFFATFNLRYWP
jgi:hypothetical protein